MRTKNIVSKLNHSEAQRQKLIDAMFNAKVEGKRLEMVSHLLGDILSNIRECFDYCAKDIYEQFILPHSDSTTANKYKNQKIKCYFPFYTGQLTNRKMPFSSLKSYAPDVHDYLIDLATKAERKEKIGNTELNYFYPMHVGDLVNEKKHNDVIEVNNKGEQDEVIGEFNNGSRFILEKPLQSSVNPIKVVMGGKTKPKVFKKVTSYRLRATGEEVSVVCLKAQKSAEEILESIYRDLFKIKIKF